MAEGHILEIYNKGTGEVATEQELEGIMNDTLPKENYEVLCTECRLKRVHQ